MGADRPGRQSGEGGWGDNGEMVVKTAKIGMIRGASDI